MNIWIKLSLVVAAGFVLTACDSEGDKQEQASQEHVWQGQVDALEKAKGVERTMMESAEQQRLMLQEQGETAE